jgi:mannosyl-3-phosphoglycerate synthase
MRLNYHHGPVCVGNVEINALSRVTELDSGLITGPSEYECHADGSTTASHSGDSLQDIERQLAIIVPCMNEDLDILLGVLSGIPHHCLIIVVSNSTPDRYQAERAMLTGFCGRCARRALILHQTDPDLASAFEAAGLPQILHHDTGINDSARRIRSGKGEAMMVGTVLAKLEGKRFVGFIDADNFVPGAVYEYCKVFATGLYHALNDPTSLHFGAEYPEEQTLAMVRIKWKSKPKITNGKLVNQESGRCSRVVNAWMNRLLTSITMRKEHCDFIQTANAGEHAMSTDLALRLNFATGYAVEPYQLVNLLESSSESSYPLTPRASPRLSGTDEAKPVSAVHPGPTIKIMQIETLNPHIHDFSKGEEHIARMQAQGLSTIFHSSLINQETKKQLQAYMEIELGIVVDDGVPEVPRTYPRIEGRKLEVFRKLI